MDKLLIRDVMTASPITLSVNSHFSEVEEHFRRYHIRHIPIVDEHKVLLGIITQRDLYRAYSPRRTLEGDSIYDREELDKLILKYSMTPNPLTLGPDEPVLKAIKIMVSTKYGCIPIVDSEKHIVGIVTQIDILKAFYRFYLNENNPEGA